MQFFYGAIFGAVFFVMAQTLFLPCGNSCREAYIRKAMSNHEWSKVVWEDIADRMTTPAKTDRE